MALDIHSVNELYTNYKPAYNNLYDIIISDSKIEDGANSLDIENYIKYHATSVNFNGETLGLIRNEVTKQFQLNETQAFTRSDTLTITWDENEDWLVKKYHEKWLGLFYNKEGDYYYSAKDEDERKRLYRTIRIILPKSTAFSGVCDCIKFVNVLPNNAPGVNLTWGSSASIVQHSLNYYVTKWEWETYNEEANANVADSLASDSTTATTA